MSGAAVAASSGVALSRFSTASSSQRWTPWQSLLFFFLVPVWVYVLHLNVYAVGDAMQAGWEGCCDHRRGERHGQGDRGGVRGDPIMLCGGISPHSTFSHARCTGTIQLTIAPVSRVHVPPVYPILAPQWPMPNFLYQGRVRNE